MPPSPLDVLTPTNYYMAPVIGQQNCASLLGPEAPLMVAEVVAVLLPPLPPAFPLRSSFSSVTCLSAVMYDRAGGMVLCNRACTLKKGRVHI